MDALSAVRLSINPALQGGAAADPLAGARQLRPPGPADLAPLTPGRIVDPSEQTPPQKSFETVLGQLVQEVNQKQLAAGDTVHGLLSGEDIPLHRVMIATEEASISFQLMVEVRNKLLEAYQELMRMQV
jgi:flagellar hook-basal body complex protein FliE